MTETNIKENAVAITYGKNFSVIQANDLVRSKQDNLSILEAKLIRLKDRSFYDVVNAKFKKV